MMNKKSSIQDVGLAMVIFFASVIMFVLVTHVYNEFVTRATHLTVINSSSVTVKSLNDSNELTKRFDYISFAVLIGFTLAIIITGFLVGGNPIFVFIYFIALIILIIVSAIMSYVWNTFKDTISFSNIVTTHFPIANHILENFPIYITIIGFLGMMAMFAKPYFGGGNEYQ